MAKPSAKKSETKITRITASDSGAKKAKEQPVKKPTPAKTKTAKPVTVKKTEKKEKVEKKPRNNLFVRVGRYFKGAWKELLQVRWPDRKATWGMTGALIVFTLFFVVVILILDYAFSELFKLILGSN